MYRYIEYFIIVILLSLSVILYFYSLVSFRDYSLLIAIAALLLHFFFISHTWIILKKIQADHASKQWFKIGCAVYISSLFFALLTIMSGFAIFIIPISVFGLGIILFASSKRLIFAKAIVFSLTISSLSYFFMSTTIKGGTEWRTITINMAWKKTESSFSGCKLQSCKGLIFKAVNKQNCHYEFADYSEDLLLYIDSLRANTVPVTVKARFYHGKAAQVFITDIAGLKSWKSLHSTFNYAINGC